VFTLEEHSILGGLGGAVAEVLAETDGVRVPFRRLGIPSHFAPRVGSQEYLLAEHGLSAPQVASTIRRFVASRVGRAPDATIISR
jgi:transketolase